MTNDDGGPRKLHFGRHRSVDAVHPNLETEESEICEIPFCGKRLRRGAGFR
jgi:hypothetical protein